jgi:DNA-binding IclR family transcriptional regulator
MEGFERRTDANVRTADRTFALLVAVVSSREPRSLADLTATTGLPLTTTARLLRGLEGSGYVECDSNGRYVIGLAFLRVAALAINSSPWLRVAQRHLRELAVETGESAYLAVLDESETHAVYVLRAPSPQPIRHWATQAGPQPIEGTAMGAALLGNVGSQGYVAVHGAVTPDTAAVAAPVRAATGEVKAAISVVGPSFRLSGDELESVGKAVCRLAHILSENVEGMEILGA